MERIEGTVGTITYQNEDNGFTVIQLHTKSNGTVTCVGNLPTIRKGETICCEGKWQRHKKFGHQLSVSGFSIVKPTTIEGLKKLLSSGFISNIGEVRAKMIIDTFGLETMDILDNHPERLVEVQGIGPKTLEKIRSGWEGQRRMRELMIFLQEFDVSLNMISKIYKAWGAESQKRICENPYALIDAVWGVGFKKADAIAGKLNFAHDSYKRIRAGLTFVLQEASNEGHLFLPAEELCCRAEEILNVDKELITFSLDHAVNAKIFIKEDDAVYLPLFYNAEQKVATDLKLRISQLASVKQKLPPEAVDSWLSRYQIDKGWKGAPEQIEAVKSAAANQILLLTGGPGTGKTTVMQVIVAFFQKLKCKIALAAPTGRAAQRMGTVSGFEAKTIHRLLEYKPREAFSRNEENPIDAEVIILDEVSMVDILLMKSFLNAVSKNTHLIFLGDDNQLPSVGAGNVLNDLIESRTLPHVHLTRIFRQAAQSRIVTAAHEIIDGAVPLFSNSKTDNCFFLPEENPQGCLEKIVDLVARRLPARYGFDSVNDIQVLSPMHRGDLGTQNINNVLQKALNKNIQKTTFGQIDFILGDKVMQIKNNYDLGVFNGDIGYISSVSDDAVSVTFDNTPVFYEHKDLSELIPAYCISIHKSQGCEFRAVIIPLTTQHFIMLQRNLIYTALTRSREICVFVGKPKAMGMAVRNDQALRRYSRLREKLL
ncbi:RecD-like DNA helicase YrrC [Chitinispirillum alkaliphilum]|nr:RecD-like DNA helicase YrrC [Chitinispirillum alkaliphilum]